MINKVMTAIVALVLVGGVAASVSVSAAKDRDYYGMPELHVVKECSQFTGQPGSFCTITSSNLAEIPAGSKIYYTQAAGIPTGLLDSNIILDDGNGNRAVGRCTLVFASGVGLCTLSDGIGQLAGFQARVDVTRGGAGNWNWDGTYGFGPVPREKK